MANPVWVLSVDLQTKTATFQSGMADAAKAARGSFQDIKDGAKEMSGQVGYSMTESRHGVMLLAEEFNIHLPRGITAFIASLGPVGAAMEAAFPFLAIVVGATLLLEHLGKLREAGQKLTEDQEKFEIAGIKALNSLDDKILEAGIRADELSGNHLAALQKRLELIDHQSMADLIHTFAEVSKAADVVFGDLKTHWYQFGSGSEGAKHALTEFQAKYDSLLTRGKGGDAADLLAGTLRSAERVLQLQTQIKEQLDHPLTGSDPSKNLPQINAFYAAQAELDKQHIGFSEKEIQAQQTLVQALRDQVDAQGRVNTLKSIEDSNAKRQTSNEMGRDSGRSAFAEAQADNRAVQAAQREQEESYKRAIGALQESEREKIEATRTGSAERLAAIDAATKEENSRGLQETDFYKSLMRSRIDIVKQMANEEAKLKADAAREVAAHEDKMGELQIELEKSQAQLLRSLHHSTAQEIMADEIRFANEENQIKQKALQDEINGLDKSAKDYENKLKALQDKETEMTQAHENKVTEIKEKAQAARDSRELAAIQKMENEVAQGLTQVLMRHESFGRMMASIGDQVLSGMIQNVLLLETLDGRHRLSDARTAAADAFKWGWAHGGPAAPVLAPVLAAGAFGVAMAFESGGIVPGVERADIVPAMLTPGEAVIPRQMTERLNRAASDEDSGPRREVHIHVHHSPTIHALDSDGMERALRKNVSVITDHINRHITRMGG